MSEFQELIKKFDKCRDYVRDFYIYGFKSRNDFTGKSTRTYDDERRRIVDWLGEIVCEDISDATSEKNLSLQISANLLGTNPLYKVWQTKSFTDNDAILYFHLLELAEDKHTVDELTDELGERFGLIFDSQIVRRKCKELAEEGIFLEIKEGRALYYVRNITFNEMLQDNEELKNLYDDPERLFDAICFFHLWYSFGFAGYTIMENENVSNDIFRVKHSFASFCLDDEVLYRIMEGIRIGAKMKLITAPNLKRDLESENVGIPIKIFFSSRTGRRFVVIYDADRYKRFSAIRLDQVKDVTIIKPDKDQPAYDIEKIRGSLDKNLGYMWNVSFASDIRGSHYQKVEMKLHIDERREKYIINRIHKEGKTGTLTKIADNTYMYEIVVFDAGEMMPWLRTFIGRIEDIRFFFVDQEMEKLKEVPKLRDTFIYDIEKLYRMYDI